VAATTLGHEEGILHEDHGAAVYCDARVIPGMSSDSQVPGYPYPRRHGDLTVAPYARAAEANRADQRSTVRRRSRFRCLNATR